MTTIFIIGVIIVVAAYVLNEIAKHRREKEKAKQRQIEYAARRAVLLAKYQDEQTVNAIMAGLVWVGMTEEQLLDSFGSPEDKSVKVYKTKTVETFKYDQTGKNRFSKRVTIENGIVVGFEEK